MHQRSSSNLLRSTSGVATIMAAHSAGLQSSQPLVRVRAFSRAQATRCCSCNAQHQHMHGRRAALLQLSSAAAALLMADAPASAAKDFETLPSGLKVLDIR